MLLFAWLRTHVSVVDWGEHRRIVTPRTVIPFVRLHPFISPSSHLTMRNFKHLKIQSNTIIGIVCSFHRKPDHLPVIDPTRKRPSAPTRSISIDCSTDGQPFQQRGSGRIFSPGRRPRHSRHHCLVSNFRLVLAVCPNSKRTDIGSRSQQPMPKDKTSLFERPSCMCTL